jgi:two-component system sensor histidine kinase SenX3
VDATAQAIVAALTGGAIVGSAALALRPHRVADTIEVEEPAAPPIPPEAASILAVLRSSSVVVDERDLVVQTSGPQNAAAVFGLVRGDRIINPELANAVQQVRRDGQIRELEVVTGNPGQASRHVTARVARLDAQLVLALLEDRTRERRIEEVRRDFVANVSHELKTPVGAIRLLAEAVEDASGDPEAVSRFADRMLIETGRLSNLVQQIIELSRLQADDPLEAPTRVSLDDVIGFAVDSSAIDASSKRINVITSGTIGLQVLGNVKQVTAAVANLVSNAVSYSPPDSIVLLTTTAVDGTVEISVVDQGIGIPSSEVERCFGRFYRVDPARHRSTGGTGLGLSIVKHVAATHGGEVRVWSVEGQGSTFTLSLPQYLTESHSDQPDPDQPDPDQPDQPDLPANIGRTARPATDSGRTDRVAPGPTGHHADGPQHAHDLLGVTQEGLRS